MRFKNERQRAALRYLFVALAVTCMVAVSEITGQREVLFPEMLALLLGAWAAPAMPWKLGRIPFAVTMTAAALAGVLIVRGGQRLLSGVLPPAALTWLQMVIGYLFVAALLLAGRSTLLPAISACILPILMGTTAWIYPVAVAVMVALTIAGQRAMERLGVRAAAARAGIPPAPGHAKPAFDCARQLRIWTGGLPVAAALAGAALASGYRFLAAPPLFVVLVTFASQPALAGRQALRSYLVIAGCGLIGACSRLLLCEQLGLPHTLCALAATGLVLALSAGTGIFFPPAGALAILPLLLPAESMVSFPLQIALGAAVCVMGGRGINIFCIERNTMRKTGNCPGAIDKH